MKNPRLYSKEWQHQDKIFSDAEIEKFSDIRYKSIYEDAESKPLTVWCESGFGKQYFDYLRKKQRKEETGKVHNWTSGIN